MGRTGEQVSTHDVERVDDALAANSSLPLVARAIAALSDEGRDVIVLVGVEGLSYQEAAEALSVPLGTIRCRLGRARLQLRRSLADSPLGPDSRLRADCSKVPFMLDDLELVRELYSSDPLVDSKSSRDAVRCQLLQKIAFSAPVLSETRLEVRGHAARRHRRHRAGVMLASAGALVAVGGGVAAAASGDLPLPWSDQKASVSFINSADPARVPGSKVHVTFPGPDATTWTFVSDVIDLGLRHIESCIALFVQDAKGPIGSPGGGVCWFASAVPGGTVSVSQERPSGPSVSLSIWRSPSGTSYAVVSGQTPTSYRSVSLESGTGAAAAIERVRNGYYLAFLPPASLLSHSHLNFYNAHGHLVSTQDVEH